MDTNLTTPSPFHPGEQALQTRVGMRDKVEAMGRKIIRDHMPDQHREFFAGLPFIFTGHTDQQGRPWGSVLSGPGGFIEAPDPHTLVIRAAPPAGDSLSDYLQVGRPLGFLGLEFHTRRRNRVNGRITAVDNGAITIAVDQSFGNCPKYIQSRELDIDPQRSDPAPAGDSEEITVGLGDAERQLIGNADTFFIATAWENGAAASSEGVDISHRGGRPGFVRVEDDGALLVPDFRGNFMFNTLGNIEQTGRAGYTFTDYASGDMLQLTGTAETLWDQAIDGWYYEGAQRYLRFRPEAGRWIRRGFPAPWRTGEASPFLGEEAEWARI